MTPAALRTLLDALGWSYRHLSDLTGVDERQCRRWAAGAPLPPEIAAWLEAAAASPMPAAIAQADATVDAWMAAHPVPRRG